MRFGELKRAIGSVTQQMLSKQLREMEKDTLINRKVHEVVHPNAEKQLRQWALVQVAKGKVNLEILALKKED